MQLNAWLQRRDTLEASIRSILQAGSPTPEQLTQAISNVLPNAFKPPIAAAEKASGDDAAMEDVKELEQAKEDVKTNWMLVEHCIFRVVESHLREALGTGSGMTEAHYLYLCRVFEVTAWVSQQKPLQLNQLAEPYTTIATLDQGCCLADLDRVFGWIELHREVVEKELVRGRLMLLRACNNLLSRISKSQHTVLCGRVSMLLSMMFPLHERSAMNLSGQVNASHKADVDETATVAENLPEEGENGITAKFYEQLWSLQTFFYAPATVLQNAVWERFSATAGVVLTVFETNPLTDASASEPVGVAANGYGTKFLTSSKLTHLEVFDAAFRRHILLQTLILLQYLRLPNSTGQGAQRHVAVTGAQLLAVQALEERVVKCLQATPPSAAEFDFSKPPVPAPTPAAPAANGRGAGGRGMGRGRRPVKEYRVRLGHAELDRLFSLYSDAEACISGERGPPDYEEFLSEVKQQADPQYCAEMELEDDCKRKHDKVYQWRALRLIARNDLAAFAKGSYYGVEEIVKYKYNIGGFRTEEDYKEAQSKKIKPGPKGPPAAPGGGGGGGASALKAAGEKERGGGAGVPAKLEGGDAGGVAAAGAAVVTAAAVGGGDTGQQGGDGAAGSGAEGAAPMEQDGEGGGGATTTTTSAEGGGAAAAAPPAGGGDADEAPGGVTA